MEPVQKSHIKSQVVDDVLEILIKNGELPPSAAQDPATPTTPNRQLSQNLAFTTSAESPSQSLVFSTTSPVSIDVSQGRCSSPTDAPTPPPPPPLPLSSFSVQLPTVLQQLQEQEQQGQQRKELSSFNADLLSSAEAQLDAAMLLSPQSIQDDSSNPQLSQEVTPSDSSNLDLRVRIWVNLI